MEAEIRYRVGLALFYLLLSVLLLFFTPGPW